MRQKELVELIEKVKTSIVDQVGDGISYHLVLVATDETGSHASMAMRCGIEIESGHYEALRYALGTILRDEHPPLTPDGDSGQLPLCPACAARKNGPQGAY